MQYLGYAISFVSVVISALLAYRLFKHDNKDDSSTLTTVIVKLETIQSGIVDIKNDLVKTKEDFKTDLSKTKEELKNELVKTNMDLKSDHDDIIRMQENLKQIWKTIGGNKDE